MRIKNRVIFYGDFETVTKDTNYFRKHEDTRVLLYYFRNDVKDKTKTIERIGTNLYDFFKDIVSIKTKSKDILMYFHNLNWDGDFILKWLGQNKFKAINFIEWKNAVNYNFCFGREGNRIFWIRVKLNDRNIYFYCTHKILSISIEQLGKSFGIDKYLNGQDNSEFYNIEPCDNWQDYPKEFVEYCKRDVDIMIKGYWNFVYNINKIREKYPFVSKIDFTKTFTIGSIAYKMQEDFVKAYALKKGDYSIYEGFKIDRETFDWATCFFGGGITQFNPKYQNTILKNIKGVCIDVNSQHPNSMTKLLPYGKLYDYFDNPPDKNKKIIKYLKLYVKKAWSKKGNFVCLKNWKALKWNVSNPNELDKSKQRYLLKAKDFYCYYMEEEWEALQEFYHFKGVEILDVKYCYADYFLKDYVHSLYEYKQHYTDLKDKANAMTYKTALNSSYGKHGTRADYDCLFATHDYTLYNDIINSKEFIFNKRNWTPAIASDYMQLENNYLLKLEKIDINLDNIFNRMIAATITAYSRIKMYESIKLIGENNFIYCDTDSIFVKDDTNINKLELHPSKLGAWDIEAEFDEICVAGAKVYYIAKDNKPIKKKYSGINQKYLEKHFEPGMFEGANEVLTNAVKKIHRCKSGLILVDADYTPKQRKL